MSALLNQSSNDAAGRYYSIGRSHIGAWSVLPLYAREAANGRGRPAFHGNTALDLLEQPQVGGVEVLKFLGEWTPPAVTEPLEEPVAEAVSTGPEPVAEAATDDDFRLATDGDLVALGSLACLLTSILSASALAGLAATLF